MISKKPSPELSHDHMLEESHEKVITIMLPTDAYFMSGIRDFTLTMIRNMTTMSDQWAYRYQSVVDELCNNAIEHGSAPGAVITVKFIIVPTDHVEVIVEDTGTGPNPLHAKDLADRVENAKRLMGSSGQQIGLRGRGLAQIVSSWTNELKFEDIPSGGIRVRAIKKLESADNVAATGFVSASDGLFA